MNKNKGTPHASKRCGAKTRNGAPCKNWGMVNGRCRMHGGKSTGARTPEGIERIRKANWKHGRYSVEAQRERRLVRQLIKVSKDTIGKVSVEITDSSC